MSERQRRLEESFFRATTEAVVARADAFSDLDPLHRPERQERRVFALALAGGCILVGALALLAPEATGPTEERASAGATSAPARGPARPAPVARRPESDQLAALLGVAPTSSAPPVAVPTTPEPAVVSAPASASPISAAPASPLALARQRMEASDFEGALALLATAPPGFETQALRGHVLYELGRDQEALGALQGALAERPDHAESLLLLGSLQQAAHPEEAARTYRTFLEAHPDAPQAAEVRQILERI